MVVRMGDGHARAAVRRFQVLGLVLTLGCSAEPSDATPIPAPPPSPEVDPARAGKVEPTPTSELAFGRKVFATLQQGDWEGYTNLLVTRADLLPLFQHSDRTDRRERKRRRRMVWRRINRLRGGGAEEGWNALRRAAEAEGVRWDAATLIDVRRAPNKDDRIPPDATAAQLRLVIDHDGKDLGIELGTSLRAERGWVSLYPMQWLGSTVTAPFGESVMSGPPP